MHQLSYFSHVDSQSFWAAALTALATAVDGNVYSLEFTFANILEILLKFAVNLDGKIQSGAKE